MKLATAINGCVLRPWVPADKPSLIANANNRNVWRNLNDVFPHPYTDADADAWFRIAGSPERSIKLAIDLNGVAIGGIGARAGEGIFVRTAHFGYWLGETYWGRGIVTAAGRALPGDLCRSIQSALANQTPAPSPTMTLYKRPGLGNGTSRASVTPELIT